MIRRAPLFCAVILTAACVACAPPPPSPPAGQPATCDAASFVGKVSYLTTPFSPGPGSLLPPTSSNSPDGHDYAADLGNVFNAASPGFQQTLCSLDRVYINAVPCSTPADCFDDSWGWWQSIRTTPNGRVVALSANLWREASYSRYETDLTQSILPSSGVTYSNAQSCSPPGVCRPIDNLTTALLAALAHEVGHIGWYVVVHPLDPVSFCGGKFFVNSWVLPINRPPLWRHLLTLAQRNTLRNAGEWRHSHKYPPHIEKIDNPLPGDPAPNQSIYGLLAPTQPWASLFAAMSPDEDFVETYKFKVLTTANPPLTSETITVPGTGTVNIVADYLVPGRKQELATKVACIPLSF
jgi:hypothetical protein